jgi:hypothetical protein
LVVVTVVFVPSTLLRTLTDPAADRRFTPLIVLAAAYASMLASALVIVALEAARAVPVWFCAWVTVCSRVPSVLEIDVAPAVWPCTVAMPVARLSLTAVSALTLARRPCAMVNTAGLSAALPTFRPDWMCAWVIVMELPMSVNAWTAAIELMLVFTELTIINVSEYSVECACSCRLGVFPGDLLRAGCAACFSAAPPKKHGSAI